MKCSSCRKGSMAERRINAKEAMICDQCRAIWLPQETVADVFRRAPGIRPEDGQGVIEELKANKVEHVVRDCPNCDRQKMDKVVWFAQCPTIYDYCRECGGIFLDPADIDLQMVNFSEQQKEAMPLANQMLMNFVFMAMRMS